MSSQKCRNCGCTEIDVDPARGDAVCTKCGSVLEDSIIVSEVQFEENAGGGSSALGQFVSDGKGGMPSFGASFYARYGPEAREATLSKAKKAISTMAQQLRINQQCTNIAFNFYKLALHDHLTRGRRSTHVFAACLYLTCRTEGTAHLLIDFSDALQVCVFELGRTYLRLAQALYINVPSMDPCLYILRFASRLEFGDKTHEVSMTALRLVQRMKKDFIHSGRRPSGLCGAALLMAARLHEFNRTVEDIVKVVKVHKSTLRKRLLEFGETPSSALTLDEFLTVDLEEAQDPPSFKAARLKDKERLQKVDDVAGSLCKLRREIELQLEERSARTKDESITELTMGAIRGCLGPEEAGEVDEGLVAAEEEDRENEARNLGLGPNMASMGLAGSPQRAPQLLDAPKPPPDPEGDLSEVDDAEIDSYILTDSEARYKESLWMRINETYLQQQKEKQERLAKEREEGKGPPEKKRRRTTRNKAGAASSAGEAIEKMLLEKKISSKINYDVLKSLTGSSEKTAASVTDSTSTAPTKTTSTTSIPTSVKVSPNSRAPKRNQPTPTQTPAPTLEQEPEFILPDVIEQDQEADPEPDIEQEQEPDDEPAEMSLADMLGGQDDEDQYYGMEDYDY